MTSAASAPPNLDPFSVVVVFATSFGMGGDFATITAAYGLIFLGAFGGAAWSATSMPQMTRIGTLMHILMMVGLALVATVPLAELLSRVSGVEIRSLLAPIAIVIAARPDWLIKTARGWLSKRGVDIPDPDAKGGPP